MSSPSIYRQLRDIGATMEGRYSDLHAKATPEALALIRAFRFDDSDDLRLMHNVYRSNIDGSEWVEVPFAWEPFWAHTSRRSAGIHT